MDFQPPLPDPLPASIPPPDAEARTEELPRDEIAPFLNVAIAAGSPAVLPIKDSLPDEAKVPQLTQDKETSTAHKGGLWSHVLPLSFFLGILVCLAWVTPYLVSHWRVSEAQGEAESAYLKRRAELKAEAEHAEQQIQLLDKKVQLVSLGFREVVRKVTTQVVHVINFREPKGNENGPLLKKTLFYDPEKDRRYLQAGVGSGLIIQPGVILTNHHVVKGAQRLRIQFPSGHSLGLDMEAVSADSITDLAILRLPNPLPAHLMDDMQHVAVWCNSDTDVQVGDWALAVGSPLGLRQTVTQGVISAKSRLLGLLDLVELLQTDAAINPGNSGGPLFDQLGRVAGINVAIASDNGNNQGIGFAIPSNTAKRIAQELWAKGEVPRGYLGIGLDELPGPQAKALELGDGGGVVITQVMPDLPAHQAGLRTGDVIVKYQGETLYGGQPVRHLRQLIVDTVPGTEVSLEIARGGQRQTVRLTMGKRPLYLP